MPLLWLHRRGLGYDLVLRGWGANEGCGQGAACSDLCFGIEGLLWGGRTGREVRSAVSEACLGWTDSRAHAAL